MPRVEAPAKISATITVPPDKSISHRALILNAIATGEAVVDPILDSDDVRSTERCLRALGVAIDWPEGSTRAVVRGAGLHGLAEAEDVLDCGNSGTTMRLLTGLLSGQPMLSVLTGDASLRTRPMSRVIAPLRQMGATIRARRGDTLAPIVVHGGGLQGMTYRSPVASAQVKSALLLAGLSADGPVTISEPSPSRDHTELMLTAMGANVAATSDGTRLDAPERLTALSLRVPGDISSAAPWMVLAACHPNAEIYLTGVNVNPTRTGILDILAAMGADIERGEERISGGEPVADITVRTSTLNATLVEGGVVPRAIDELPLVALAACFAEGRTVIRGAAELRVKESDRIDATVKLLSRMGAKVTALEDGIAIEGPVRLHGAAVDARFDHRIGMLGAMAGLLATGKTDIRDDAVAISYPTFWDDVATVRGSVER